MPQLAEEMLDGQHHRVHLPTKARAAHHGLLQKRLEEDLCCSVHHANPHPHPRPHPNGTIGQRTELNHSVKVYLDTFV